jgi:hypothetical protein
MAAEPAGVTTGVATFSGDGWAHVKKGADEKTQKPNWECNYCMKKFSGMNITRVSRSSTFTSTLFSWCQALFL